MTVQNLLNLVMKLGIELFQGHHVENLIAEENRRKNMRFLKKRTAQNEKSNQKSLTKK